MTTRGKLFIVGGVVAALALAAAGYFVFVESRGKGTTAGAVQPATPASGRSERKILYWTDPMIPGFRSDKPGKSPMGMDMVPVYADESGQRGGITIDPRVIENMGVRTAAVEKGTISSHVDTVGYVKPDERRIEVVQSRAAGWVERLSARAVNDPVKKGQPLLEIYAPDLLAAQEEFLLTLKGAPGAERDTALVEAARRRLQLLGVSEGQIRRLEQTGKASRRITLYSPVTGVVSDLGVREGAAVSPSQPVMSLLDLSTVWVIAEVPENQSAWVAQGDKAEVRLPSLPGKAFDGKVDYVYPELSAGTRTLKARVRLDNPGGMLKPNMFANVRLSGGASREALLIPTEAVIYTGKRSVVIVADGQGRFHPVDVVTGEESGGKTQILKGLEEGQRVVTSGQFLIDSEANLQAGMERLESAPEAAPGMAAAPAPAASAGAASTGVIEGHGMVNGVDMKAGTVNLTHGPIQAIGWPGMTMDFPVQDKSLLSGIKPGVRVDFRLSPSADGQYAIVAIKPVGKGNAK